MNEVLLSDVHQDCQSGGAVRQEGQEWHSSVQFYATLGWFCRPLLGGTNVCHQSHPNTMMGSSTNKPARARETLWCIFSALCQSRNGMRSQLPGEVATITRESYLIVIFLQVLEVQIYTISWLLTSLFSDTATRQCKGIVLIQANVPPHLSKPYSSHIWLAHYWMYMLSIYISKSIFKWSIYSNMGAVNCTDCMSETGRCFRLSFNVGLIFHSVSKPDVSF